MRAKLLVTVPGGSYITLSAFGSVGSDIAQTKEVTAEDLIVAPSFTLTYRNNTVNSVSRP